MYCNSTSCSNKGICLEANGTFTCICNHEYTGSRCQRIRDGKKKIDVLTIVLTPSAIIVVIVLIFTGVYVYRRKAKQVRVFEFIFEVYLSSF